MDSERIGRTHRGPGFIESDGGDVDAEGAFGVYAPPERVLGAFAASESAAVWLENNPPEAMGDVPPDTPKTPKADEDFTLPTAIKPRHTEQSDVHDMPLAA